ncbi:hypothetical protein RMCBS344292_12642 [Rhizopus microsporus]|nr:hypothetical protein RMCBS344292_12642 [Rhizopus microsporus]
MSRPLSNSPLLTNTEDMAQSHAISSYVDSVLGQVATFNPSLGPTPTPTKSFALPKIPSVSKFNDILPEDEQGSEFIFPANPSSIIIPSMVRSESYSSINSAYSSLQKEKINQPAGEVDSKEDPFMLGTPEIFDFITSDEDERFIIWGPDPIILSSSMATATSLTPERPSSYATLYNNQHSRPELKGFSSNTTSTLIRSKSVQNEKNGRFGSVRLSDLRKPLKHSLSSITHKDGDNNNSGHSGGSFLLRKAFGIKRSSKTYSNDSASISTADTTAASIPTSLADIPKVIEAATIHKLVEKLTNTLDYTFMTDFFLTYRDFLRSEELCQLLISRFTWALQNDEENRRIVRIRTFVVLRHWLSNYFVHDFIGNYNLRKLLTDFLNKLARHPLVKTSPRDQRIVKTLKRVVRRLKKLYYTRSSAASRVKIIAPPPPTFEQEQMGELVRAKLSQNVIRRKTAIRVDMSGDHHGNMAVQDARYAPVVVVGSVNMKTSMIESGVDCASKSSQLRRYPSQVSAPSVATAQHPEESLSYHRYDKSAAEMPEAETKSRRASSIASAASEDSLESEISAGKTIPDETDDEDCQSHLQDSFTEYDEHDLHWLREQQETIEYFKALAKQQEEEKEQHLSDENGAESSKDDTKTKPSELANLIKSDITSENSAPPSPITPNDNSTANEHSVRRIPSEKWCRDSTTDDNRRSKQESDINEHSVRRIPSEKWCRDSTTDDNRRSKQESDISKALPEELLKELEPEEDTVTRSTSPLGLSRKLSKKSIERRKSEKNFQDIVSGRSSAVSSTATSPHLIGTGSNRDVPEMPPLSPEMFGDGIPVAVSNSKKKTLKKKKSGLKKKSSFQSSKNGVEESADTFAAIPYEQTEDLSQEQTKHQDIGSNQPSKSPSKRKLTKAISKVFKQSQPEDTTKDEPVSSPQSFPNESNVRSASEENVKENEKQEVGGRFVSLIAEQLRSNISRDDFDIDCECRKCTGNKNSTEICKRFSVMLIPDEERRRSFELRRRRGASVDMGNRMPAHPLDDPFSNQRSSKTFNNGPVYLGQLDTKSIIESCAGNKGTSTTIPRIVDDSDDDHSTVSFTPSEKSIQTEGQAGSSRAGRASMVSSSNPRRSKIMELDIPPVSPGDETYNGVGRSVIEGINVPQHITSRGSSGKSFIMSYRTSKLASQFCFIERDVLIKVGWEELIHCKWTKMDADGKINPNYAEPRDDALFDDGMNTTAISYTRQSEKRRAQGQGIEHVIQRFNTVCQWVSSEIVRTKNINDRVKLIEKFIRLAMKCKLYSNYATLVQILLGLQSPAIARLEKTWSKVSVKYHRQLNKLTEFTSPMKNWKHIRDSMTEVAEEYGNSPAEVQVEMPGTSADKQKFKKTRIKIPFGGCIPFLGIYLSDLVFNSEKPKHLKPNLENRRIYNANTARNLPACLDQPLVNFRKYRVIATVIKRVLIFQGLATRYSFDEDPILKEMCRSLEVLDAATIRELSSQIQ